MHLLIRKVLRFFFFRSFTVLKSRKARKEPNRKNPLNKKTMIQIRSRKN